MYSSHIILIIDQSGSMSCQKDNIINGINEMIKQQRGIHSSRSNEIVFDIVKFSYTVEFNKSETLMGISFITYKDYVPGGLTALYDAIGTTINRYKEEKNVIVVIATDGLENASRKYNYKQIADMITTCTEEKKWKFIYLSEDIDTFKQGNDIGITNNTAVGSQNLGLTFTSGNYNVAIGHALSTGIVDLSNVGGDHQAELEANTVGVANMTLDNTAVRSNPSTPNSLTINTSCT